MGRVEVEEGAMDLKRVQRKGIEMAERDLQEKSLYKKV